MAPTTPRWRGSPARRPTGRPGTPTRARSSSRWTARAQWGTRDRPPAAATFADAARALIAETRAAHPYAVARATLDDGGVRLSNRGEAPLAIRDGAVRTGDSGRLLNLAHAAPSPIDLPDELAPGGSVVCPLPAAAPHALVSLRWRTPAGDWLDGWILAGD